MPIERCEFCTSRPSQEVAVSRWVSDPDDRDRLTILVCTKHLQRLQKAGPSGWEHRGLRYKTGFW